MCTGQRIDVERCKDQSQQEVRGEEQCEEPQLAQHRLEVAEHRCRVEYCTRAQKQHRGHVECTSCPTYARKLEVVGSSYAPEVRPAMQISREFHSAVLWSSCKPRYRIMEVKTTRNAILQQGGTRSNQSRRARRSRAFAVRIVSNHVDRGYHPSS